MPGYRILMYISKLLFMAGYYPENNRNELTAVLPNQIQLNPSVAQIINVNKLRNWLHAICRINGELLLRRNKLPRKRNTFFKGGYQALLKCHVLFQLVSTEPTYIFTGQQLLAELLENEYFLEHATNAEEFLNGLCLVVRKRATT